MIVTGFGELPGSRSLTWSGQGGRSYSVTLRIVTDDKLMGPRAVAKAMGLRIGESYALPLSVTPTEWDYGSYLQSFDLKEEGDGGMQWLLTLNYGPFNWTEQGGATTEAASDGQTNPFSVPPKVSFGTAKFDRECHKDANGKPLVNNVGDPYDPPFRRDDSRATLTIVRNEPYFNSQYVQTFKDTVNRDVFLGIYKANTVKCADVTAEREYQADWGWHWVVTYTFEIREFTVDANNATINNGWTESILNTGHQQWVDPNDHSKGKQPICFSGSPVTKPVPLWKDGMYHSLFDVDPVYNEFDFYPSADFSKFNFPDDLLTVQSSPGGGGS